MDSILATKLLEYSYRLDSSRRYTATKSFFRNILQNDSYRYKKYFDYFMIFMVLLSVAIYIMDIRTHLSEWLWNLEIFLTMIFALEYLLRLWVYSDVHKSIILYLEDMQELRVRPSIKSVVLNIFSVKAKFALHPMSVIDFLSIHPELRPLRLFKIFRYSEITISLLSTLASKKYEFGVLFILISITIFIASSLFYVFEAENPKINTFFDAIYWAVITIATVGYGDVVPSTTGSKVISIFLVFAGLGVIAMLTSLVTSTFSQRITAIKEQKSNQHIESFSNYTLVCGFGKMGEELAQRLSDSKVGFVVIDVDRNRIERAKTLGYKALYADASKLDTLKALGIGQKVTAVIVVTRSDITNLSIVLAVRSICKTVKIIAKANDEKNKNKLLFAGANDVIGLSAGSRALALYLESPIAFQAVYELIADDKNALVDEITISCDLCLGQLETAEFGCLALAVKRGDNFLLNPQSEFELLEGDILVIAGRPRRIEGLRMRLAWLSHA